MMDAYIARSNEAKALGIPMGAPHSSTPSCSRSIASWCIPPILRYTAISRTASWIRWRQFTDDVQIYSIDEAFLRLHPPDFIGQAQEIRRVVCQWTGIPVSIGIAPTKTLAKAANRFAKKDPAYQGAVLIETEAERERILSCMPVEDVWGIGRRLSVFLKGKGLHTAWDFCNAEDAWIRKHLSVVGLRMAWELRGISCLDIQEAPLLPKNRS